MIFLPLFLLLVCQQLLAAPLAEDAAAPAVPDANQNLAPDDLFASVQGEPNGEANPANGTEPFSLAGRAHPEIAALLGQANATGPDEEPMGGSDEAASSESMEDSGASADVNAEEEFGEFHRKRRLGSSSSGNSNEFDGRAPPDSSSSEEGPRRFDSSAEDDEDGPPPDSYGSDSDEFREEGPDDFLRNEVESSFGSSEEEPFGRRRSRHGRHGRRMRPAYPEDPDYPESDGPDFDEDGFDPMDKDRRRKRSPAQETDIEISGSVEDEGPPSGNGNGPPPPQQPQETSVEISGEMEKRKRKKRGGFGGPVQEYSVEISGEVDGPPNGPYGPGRDCPPQQGNGGYGQVPYGGGPQQGFGPGQPQQTDIDISGSFEK